MRIVILSTDTLHHIYFINSIASEFDIAAVYYETDSASFPYDVTSPYAQKEEGFERKNFFRNTPRSLSGKLNVFRVPSVNSKQFMLSAGRIEADIAIVFGCGRIKPHVFGLFREGLINIHRGLATHYRGLDCDIWPIFHDDFQNIGVTLHYVDEGLDTGDIIAMRKIEYSADDKIYKLRHKTTVMATDMMKEALRKIIAGGGVKSGINGGGRYYCAMPSALKSLCQRKFDAYIKKKV
ncbi:MAG: hypothetical protein JW800_05565 [Candidatus Omnitrophica bacterium]|nr:hypothetical protein [Candidatus Omnitrophota bacterium]